MPDTMTIPMLGQLMPYASRVEFLRRVATPRKREGFVTKLRELWAIRRRCKQIRRGG